MVTQIISNALILFHIIPVAPSFQEVVRDGETGFLMKSNRAMTIQSDIAEILRRGDLDEISAAGRKLICDEYSFEAAVDRYRTILDSLSNSS